MLPDSPTRRVGAPPAEGFTPAEHRVPLLSLDNAMSEAELRAFVERVQKQLDGDAPVALLGEPKLDGSGVELVYERGELAVGSTRGDGRVGEDVTANLKQVVSVPLALWGVQMALNVAWSALFFGLRSPGLAFVGIVLLWLAILGTAVAAWPVAPGASLLFAPYLAWVAFAGALNLAIWRLN